MGFYHVASEKKKLSVSYSSTYNFESSRDFELKDSLSSIRTSGKKSGKKGKKEAPSSRGIFSFLRRRSKAEIIERRKKKYQITDSILETIMDEVMKESESDESVFCMSMSNKNEEMIEMDNLDTNVASSSKKRKRECKKLEDEDFAREKLESARALEWDDDTSYTSNEESFVTSSPKKPVTKRKARRCSFRDKKRVSFADEDKKRCSWKMSKYDDEIEELVGDKSSSVDSLDSYFLDSEDDSEDEFTDQNKNVQVVDTESTNHFDCIVHVPATEEGDELECPNYENKSDEEDDIAMSPNNEEIIHDRSFCCSSSFKRATFDDENVFDLEECDELLVRNASKTVLDEMWEMSVRRSTGDNLENETGVEESGLARPESNNYTPNYYVTSRFDNDDDEKRWSDDERSRRSEESEGSEESEEEEEEEEEETEEEEEESEDDYVIKNAGQIVSTKLLEWNEPIVTSFENESLSTEELCSDDDSLESISQQYLPTEFAAYRVKNNLFRCNDHMYEEEEEEEEEEMYSDEDAQECSSSETSDTQNNECKL